jgi:hypothetical protein
MDRGAAAVAGTSHVILPLAHMANLGAFLKV